MNSRLKIRFVSKKTTGTIAATATPARRLPRTRAAASTTASTSRTWSATAPVFAHSGAAAENEMCVRTRARSNGRSSRYQADSGVIVRPFWRSYAASTSLGAPDEERQIEDDHGEGEAEQVPEQRTPSPGGEEPHGERDQRKARRPLHDRPEAE